MVQVLLLMACLVMLLMLRRQAWLLLLLRRQAWLLSGWEVWLGREGGWFYSPCHQVSNHGRGNWGHSWHH